MSRLATTVVPLLGEPTRRRMGRSDSAVSLAQASLLLPRQCPVERSHQLFQCRQIQCGTSSTISAADHTQDDAYRILEVAVPTRIAVVASFFSAHRPSFAVPILQDGRGQRAAASGLADSTATRLASITEGEVWTACPGMTWSDRNRGNVRDITREVAIIRTSSGRARRISSPFRPDTTLHARRAPNISVSPDGRRGGVWSASGAGDDPVNCLWVLDAVSGDERLVADPREPLSDAVEGSCLDAERARRERA